MPKVALAPIPILAPGATALPRLPFAVPSLLPEPNMAVALCIIAAFVAELMGASEHDLLQISMSFTSPSPPSPSPS